MAALNEKLFKNIIIDAMHRPRYRYGYENAWICERNGQIAGVFFGYPSEWETLIDGPWIHPLPTLTSDAKEWAGRC